MFIISESHMTNAVLLRVAKLYNLATRNNTPSDKRDAISEFRAVT